MTTLSASLHRDRLLGDEASYPVIAGDIIYAGAAVGDNGSGYARPLVAGDPFLGFALSKADNSAGGAGDIKVQTLTRGRFVLTVAGSSITSAGLPVYASDDDTVTLTAGSNSPIGLVSRWDSGTTCIVDVDATTARLLALIATKADEE